LKPAFSKELHELAVASRLKSHSPYSGHKVGAAIRLKSGRTFGGCNIENSSYGGTVCAERVAIWKAVSELGPSVEPIQIEEIVVVTDANPPWPPCGLCRQVISEFGTPQTRVTGTNLAGGAQSFTFGELLPHAFTPGHLLK
jgi:cytidine deaminase